MDSKVVQSAAAVLLASLTLAALAWGIKILVEAVAIVNSMILNAGVSSFAGRLTVFAIAIIIVAAVTGGGYFFFDKRLKPKEEAAEEE